MLDGGRKYFSCSVYIQSFCFFTERSDQDCRVQFSISVRLGCGAPTNTPHYLMHNDYRRVHARPCVCTCDPLLICCLPFVFLSLPLVTVYRRDSPHASCFPQCTMAFIRVRGGKKMLGCKASLVLCNLLCFPASLVLPWPCCIRNHEVKFHIYLCCLHANAA